MAFTVIPGGLFVPPEPTEEDFPDLFPGKSITEMTDEEKAIYDAFSYENAEPGGIEYTIKTLSIDPADLRATIRVLEAIKDTYTAEIERLGYNDPWRSQEAHFLLTMLKQREKADREKS